MFQIFKKQPVLEEDIISWLFSAYAWSLRNIRSSHFDKIQLIEPTNRFFSGRETSEHGMAELIFEQVKSYVGVSDWPCQLIDRHIYDETRWPVVNIKAALASLDQQEKLPLIILFEPLQARNPEVMIANYVYALSYHLADLAQEPLPCDMEQWPCLLELIGVYLGFGVMFVNTASPKKAGGCGSCRSPLMERQGQLSEDEVTYALAIFCVLKGIPTKQVTPLLKGYQRAFFKRALNDVMVRKDSIENLQLTVQSPQQLSAD